MPRNLPFFLLVLLALGVLGCGGKQRETPPPSGTEGNTSRPASQEITSIESVEDLTEKVADRIIEFSDALRKRDPGRAASYLAAGFQGIPFKVKSPPQKIQVPLDISRVVYDPRGQKPVAASAWLASLQERLAPLSRLDRVFFKTKEGEFEKDRKSGRLRLAVHVIGRLQGGGIMSLEAGAHAQVILEEGRWKLLRFDLEHWRESRRARPIFTDVAAVAGVARRLPRLGTPKNRNFYWRGAAAGDVNQDGLIDIFASTHAANLLFINQGNGRFQDEAQKLGLAAPVGATTPLFLDYDNDGDQDLLCAFVGWEKDGVPYGQSLHLFRNDGSRGFTDVSEQTGLAAFRGPWFSAVAADFNNDGTLDLYVCGYNRLDAVYPNSWYRATNGTPNLLLLNRGGRRFENAAQKSGVAGGAWSYAAAAADFDEDGDQDLYVANDYGDNNLYKNRGDGTFEDVAASSGVLDTGNGMGVRFGDLNGDGRLDIYVSNMSSSAGNRILKRFAQGSASLVEHKLFKLAAGNSIFLQEAGGHFKKLPRAAGGVGASWAWSPALLDVNLDGRLDVYVANGFISGNSLKDT